jgi:hypothetical protein
LAGTTGATTGATFGALAARVATGFLLVAVAARRLGAGFAFGLGLAARVAFLAGFRAVAFLAGRRFDAVFFLTVREAAFLAGRRFAAAARAFLARFALVAGRFFVVDRDLFIGSPLLRFVFPPKTEPSTETAGCAAIRQTAFCAARWSMGVYGRFSTPS